MLRSHGVRVCLARHSTNKVACHYDTGRSRGSRVRGVLGRGRIRDADCNSDTTNVRVVKREAGGKAVVLDEGSGISPRSLKRHEATLSWLHGDARRTATMR